MMPATTATHCPYRALQCGVHLATGPDGLIITGDHDFPVNNGALCVQDRAAESLDPVDRRRQLVPITCCRRGRCVRFQPDVSLKATGPGC
jgi:hypothetical protein